MAITHTIKREGLQRGHETIKCDPSTSNWLRDAITTSYQRDPVDALNDAEALTMLLVSRLAADTILIDIQRQANAIAKAQGGTQ